MAKEVGVYSKAIHSGKWLLVSAAIGKIINLATFFIAARLLLPRDYGIITIIFTFIELLDSLLSPGFGPAVLQKKDDISPYLSVLWTFDLVKASAIAFLIYFFAPSIASFFRISPTYVILLRLSCFLPIISSLANIKQIFFFRDLEYKKVFIRDIVGQLAYTITVISFALLISPSVWALFLANLARYSVGTIMSYILYPAWPRLSFRFRSLKQFFGYSKWIYGQKIFDFALGAIDKVLVGRLLDPTQLGLYSRAKDSPSILLSPLSDLFGKIGFSAYVKIQDELHKIQEGFLKSLDIVLLVTIPFSLLILFEGGSVVTVLLGQKWLGLVVSLKVFSVGNVFLGLLTMLNPIFNALGRPEIGFKINFVQLILSPFLFYSGIKLFQLEGAAIAAASLWIILLLYGIWHARPVLKIASAQFFPTFIPFVSASLATIAVAWPGHYFIHRYLTDIQVFIWVICLGVLFLGVTYLVSKKFNKGPYATVKSVLRELGILKNFV